MRRSERIKYSRSLYKSSQQGDAYTIGKICDGIFGRIKKGGGKGWYRSGDEKLDAISMVMASRLNATDECWGEVLFTGGLSVLTQRNDLDIPDDIAVARTIGDIDDEESLQRAEEIVARGGVLYSGQLSTAIKYDGNTAIFHQHEDIGLSMQTSQEIAVSANSMEKEAGPEQSGGWDDYPLGSW